MPITLGKSPMGDDMYYWLVLPRMLDCDLRPSKRQPRRSPLSGWICSRIPMY
jgi:hypothetical protein